jgi:putative exosortase-associated protein (TIGR04073 family)
MRKALCVLAAFVFLFTSSMSFAETGDVTSEDVMNGMGAKMRRGAINTFTGWIEIPAQIAKGYEYGFMGKDNTGFVGAIGGIFAGIGTAAGRTISGVGELVGFWAVDPDGNEGMGIPLDAEYAWETGTPYDMTDPSFMEATTRPVLKKLGRGLGNLLCGVAEIPGQIMKGIEEKAWDAGICKGIWYCLSREIDGAFDVATFLLPGPRDTKGVPFDEKWPWSAAGDRTTSASESTTTTTTTTTAIK